MFAKLLSNSQIRELDYSLKSWVGILSLRSSVIVFTSIIGSMRVVKYFSYELPFLNRQSYLSLCVSTR